MERILIAAHRGKHGGNIVENTLPAFEAAIHAGADIIEADISRLKDGSFVLFHNQNLKRLTGINKDISQCTLEQIQKLPLYNSIGNISGAKIPTLQEFLAVMKNRVMINLDKADDFLPEILTIVKEFEMMDQILLKGEISQSLKDLAFLRENQFNIQYIPVVKKEADWKRIHEILEQYQIKIIEFFILSEESPLLDPQLRHLLKTQDIKLWYNALTLGNAGTINAGHDDSLSITGSPDDGWGWLIDHGASIIQTDWVTELNHYLLNKKAKT